MGESSFLSQFVMITDFKTVIFITLLILTFIIIRSLEKRKVKFSTRTIIATIIGLCIGVVIQLVAGFPEDPSKVVWLNEVSKWYSLFGSGFMDLLKMLVVPMVFVSMLRVIISMGEDSKIKSLTVRTIGMLLITTAISALVGIVVGNVMNLGIGVGDVAVEATTMREITPIVDTLRGLLPSNPVAAMAEGNVVAIIIFATFLGMAVKRMRKKYEETIKPFIDLVEAFYKIIISVAMTIIRFMPYAVVAMISNTLINKGLASMISVFKFIVALYLSIVIVFIIHLIIIAVNGLNPIKYLKNAAEPLLLAFTSRSSLGTLPVAIESLTDKQGVEEGGASFSASLGANMGMNGCAGIYTALMAVTIGNMAGINMDFSFYSMLLVVITIASIGIAGLPGTATMAVSVVVSGVGLGSYFPLAAGIIAIDPILDMGRTMLNVNGSMVTTIVANKSLGNFKKDIFSSNK